jgi:hypothetical protein
MRQPGTRACGTRYSAVVRRRQAGGIAHRAFEVIDQRLYAQRPQWAGRRHPMQAERRRRAGERTALGNLGRSPRRRDREGDVSFSAMM